MNFAAGLGVEPRSPVSETGVTTIRLSRNTHVFYHET